MWKGDERSFQSSKPSL